MTFKKEKKQLLREFKNERDELLDILKAIINKFSKQEMIVSDEEIAKSKQYQLYVSNEYLSCAKRYQLINPKEILESYREEK